MAAEGALHYNSRVNNSQFEAQPNQVELDARIALVRGPLELGRGL